jgi:moderate conductance mechanosensitive channel
MLLGVSTESVFSAESSPTTQEESMLEAVDKVINPDAEVVKIIEVAEESTQETIEEKKAEVEQVKKEAEKVLEEKVSVGKEVEIKEAAAKIAKAELETARQEAETTSDVAAITKVETLEEEASKLEAEAATSKKKLAVVVSKAGLAQKTLAVSEEGWIEKGMSVGLILLIGVAVFFLLELGIKFFQRALTKKDVIRESALVLRLKTLSKLFHWVAVIAVIGVVSYSILEHLGVDVRPLLAGLGIIGLAFGFGGQYLIRDLINGIFILMEGQYRINDVVKIGDHGGLVEDVNLRITTLRDLGGRVIIIPNGEIKTVINFTKYYAQALLDIGVAYKENVDRVMDVIKELGREMRKDEYFSKLILDDLEMLGVDEFADSQVTIKFRIKTLPIKQWEVSREFRRRVKNRFDELGIEIPFPHQTLYWGADKDNDWMKEFARRGTLPKSEIK